MTLFKQIAIIFTLIFVTILSIVMLQNFNNTKEFVKSELYTSSSETAVALGMSINSFLINKNYKPSKIQNFEDESGLEDMDDSEAKKAVSAQSGSLSKGDIPLFETMINAVFDKGYYESIRLYDMNGNVVIDKSQNIVVKGIPTWFINFVDLESPSAKTYISGGWTNVGIIEVKKHTGNSIVKLWKNFNAVIKTFYIITAIALLILFLLLQFTLKSLKRVEEQAIAVEKNDFIINKDIPFTTEFKQVTLAMNGLIEKVKDIFEKETKYFKQYQDLLYIEEESGLHNRKYLNLKFNNYLSSDSSESHGIFFLMHCDLLERAKNDIGYKNYKEILVRMGRKFKEFTSKVSGTFATRVSQTDFMVVVPNYSLEVLKPELSELESAFEKVLNDYDLEEKRIATSVTRYDNTMSFGDVLSRADFLLSTAKQHSESYIHYDSGNISDESLMGKSEWQQFFTESFEQKRFTLAVQPVMDVKKSVTVHQECFLRLKKEDSILNAGYFMPTAYELGFADEIDKVVIEQAIELVLTKEEPVSINIDTSFIEKASNIDWLRTLLRKVPVDTLGKLSFEAKENQTLHDLALYENFTQMLRAYNCQFGIDHFIGGEDLAYLQEIKPAFIKIDSKLIQEMNDSNSGSMRSIEIIAKSLDIRIIAVFVEENAMLESMQSCGVACMSGNHIKKAELI
jgi:EAL domain-containing protein (putative c-di-GMP-specific phosphodiesterase class I)/GGDEF domain-containing protein